LICHPEVAALATEERVWLASLPDCREFRPQQAETLQFEKAREGHDFSRAAKPPQNQPRFSAC
jgi:hypothetical protein